MRKVGIETTCYECQRPGFWYPKVHRVIHQWDLNGRPVLVCDLPPREEKPS